MAALSRLRDRRVMAGLAVVGALAVAGPVGALTSILVRGVIDHVAPAADPNPLGIEQGDEFLVLAQFDETLLAGGGRETLTPDTDANLSFELRIGRGPAVVWDEQDDLIFPFGPLINFEGGEFDSFVFQSDDFGFASDAFVQVVGDLKIFASDGFSPLITGTFRGLAISPD